MKCEEPVGLSPVNKLFHTCLVVLGSLFQFSISEDRTNIMERNSTVFELCLAEEEQDDIYKLASDGLTFIVKCFPL